MHPTPPPRRKSTYNRPRASQHRLRCLNSCKSGRICWEIYTNRSPVMRNLLLRNSGPSIRPQRSSKRLQQRAAGGRALAKSMGVLSSKCTFFAASGHARGSPHSRCVHT
eukprot:6193371-Pleurochrysis_carterae.AAC.2